MESTPPSRRKLFRHHVNSLFVKMNIFVNVLLVILALQLPQISTADDSLSSSASPLYRLSLNNIYSSHGILRPDFSPDQLTYKIHLQHARDQIAITPEVDQTREEYFGEEVNMPVVTLKWKNRMNNKPEASSLAVRKQIDLPDIGGHLDVYIEVSNPHTNDKLIYTVSVFQSKTESVAVLKSLEVTDNFNNNVYSEPITTTDNIAYGIYVNPNADSINITPHCAEGNKVYLDGVKITNGEAKYIYREKDHYRQLLELTCQSGDSHVFSKKYFLTVVSEMKAQDIPHPDLVVDGRGKSCRFDDNRQQYLCPNPKTKDYRTRLIGTISQSIRYTIESQDKTVEVRLLSDVPTIPFTFVGVGNINLIGVSGRHNVTWPIRFNGAAVPGLMRLLGWLLGLLLALLLISLLAVLGLSNVMGIGTPIGVTEIATTMTLLQQFFCFTSVLRGSNLLSEMTEALRWVTLYWPLPWSIDSHNNTLSRWGDVSDLNNAYGCLFWSSTLFAVFSLVHIIIISRFKCCTRNNTFPHRLRFGNWESRCLHWLAFPVATACGMILTHPDSSGGWKFAAGSALGSYCVWGIGIFVILKTATSKKQAIWVWHNSVREDGELEDESGYWSDIICDQLLTQPVNRSLFKWLFPWRWVSTVADVDPVSICPRMYYRGEKETEEQNDLHPVDNYHRSHKESTYPLGKNPKTVDVIRTLSPGTICPGQRLIAGLLRTEWLDILFTFQGLTKFHTHMSNETGRDFIIPLTVKTCQLTGPITGGVNHFFYDGARIPFIRIADTFYRTLIGLCIGMTLSSQSYRLDAGMFGSVACLSLGLFVYHCVGSPYSRKIENWVLGALLLTISSISFSFVGYALNRSEPSLFTDVFLWITCFVVFVLSTYSAVVLFSVYSAIMCPPLEETRFLEKLANCNVTIADSEWAVDVPAFNKYGARDLKAQCNYTNNRKIAVSVYPSGEEATIEFDAQEMVQACRSGNLRLPILSLFCPDSSSPIGYRHVNIYQKNDLVADVAGFLAADRTMRYGAEDVARHIGHQINVRGRGKAVVTMTVILPKKSKDYDDVSSSSTSVYSSRADRDGVSARYGGRRSRPSVEMGALYRD